MKTNTTILKIFEYDNYRTFLKDLFFELKKSNKAFTHRYFARAAGFQSSSYCSHVMDGKKNLSPESIKKMSAGIGLDGKAARYFENLVLYNQAKSLQNRELYFGQLVKLRKSASFYRVNKNQFVLYEEWYYSVIRECAVYGDWNGDFEKLGTTIVPPISKEKAKKAVDALLEVGLLIKDETGRYRQSSAIISAEAAPPVIVNKLKKEFLVKALESEENFSKPDRYSSSATISMSLRNYDRAKNMVDDVRKEILAMAAGDTNVEKVFQANFQIFPLTQKLNSQGSAEDAHEE